MIRESYKSCLQPKGKPYQRLSMCEQVAIARDPKASFITDVGHCEGSNSLSFLTRGGVRVTKR